MIDLRPLNSLDADLVAASIAETTQRLNDSNPTLDLRRGILAEIVVYSHSLLDTQRAMNINDYLAGRSLQQIAADPTLADPALVDDVMSNFRVTRKPGLRSSGNVTVVVSDDLTVTIAQGSIWESRGKRFISPRVYTAKAEAGQVTQTGDRLLTAINASQFAFTITLEAETEGVDFDIPRNSAVIPQTVPQNYIRSYATNDFRGGRAVETNNEVLQRLQEGIAAKAISNRVNMAAMLHAIEAFADVTAMSIIGFGDAEMHRDQHSLLPLSLGGRVDWYVRTQKLLYRQKLTVTATLVQTTTDSRGIWQFSVGRDDAPGFYEFADIQPGNAVNIVGGYPITEDSRGFDVTGTGFIPDVATLAESAYSRYSTAVVRFKDTDTDTTSMAVGTTQDYVVYAVGLPLIADIQTLVASRDVRSHGADCLVRAPVPCFVHLAFTIEKAASDADPDLDAIKAALVEEINSIGFIGRLFASQIYDVIHGYLRNNQTVSNLDIFSRLRYPAASSPRYLRSGDMIEIPDEPENGVTARTVQFFVDPAWIAASVVTAVPSDL